MTNGHGLLAPTIGSSLASISPYHYHSTTPSLAAVALTRVAFHMSDGYQTCST